MKYAMLVAMREYAENAKTKGFWIGLLLFPIMIVLGIQVPKFLAKATPTRYFVLVDQSNEFGETVEGALERYRVRKKMEAYQTYIRKYVDEEKAKTNEKPDFEKLPAIQLDPTAMFDAEKFAESMVGGALDGLAETDNPDAIFDMMAAAMAPMLKEDRPEFEEPKVRFQAIGLPSDISADAEPEVIVEGLKPYLLGDSMVEVEGEKKELFAAVVIPRDPALAVTVSMANVEKKGAVEYWSTNLADTDLRNEIQRSINNEVRRRAYVERGVEPEVVKQVENVKIEFTAKNPKKEKGKEEVSMADTIRQWAPVGFVYLLFIAIMTVTQMLLNNTVEEKSNRIIEVLLSSVTAGELMLGKLIGILAIGLTMTGTWIVSLFVVHTIFKSPEMEFMAQIFDVLRTSNLLPAFAIYFILGYLFYAGIFLSIGSLCNTLKDAQNFMGPVMIIMMVPLFTMMFIPKDPNGTLATFLSWVPLYTPFIMMNRAAADPPMFEQVGTLILMIVSAAGMLWLSGKIFRRGILRTGQPPKVLELLRWMKG